MHDRPALAAPDTNDSLRFPAGFQLQQIAHRLRRQAIVELDDFDIELAGLGNLAHQPVQWTGFAGIGLLLHEGAEAMLALDQAGRIEVGQGAPDGDAGDLEHLRQRFFAGQRLSQPVATGRDAVAQDQRDGAVTRCSQIHQ